MNAHSTQEDIEKIQKSTESRDFELDKLKEDKLWREIPSKLKDYIENWERLKLTWSKIFHSLMEVLTVKKRQLIDSSQITEILKLDIIYEPF